MATKRENKTVLSIEEKAAQRAAAFEALSKHDSTAPQNLIVRVFSVDPNGQERCWGEIRGNAKVFSTGSVGYNISGKVMNSHNGKSYQISANATLIGSKSAASVPAVSSESVEL